MIKTIALGIALAAMATGTALIVDFTKKSTTANWQIVDDGVMGGKSQGNFKINKEGHAEFWGMISLENYGGFSSVRYRPETIEIGKYKKVALRIKGDGKNYQFRIKGKANEYFSYITSFSTSGEWETININLSDLYPSFRGRKLDLPNFSGSQIEEITLLIGNKKKESFKLLIDEIRLTK